LPSGEEPIMSSPPKKPRRTGTIKIRITPEQRALIDRAAAAQQKRPSASTPAAAPGTAEVVPLDQALSQVDAATYARLVEMLEGPPQLNDRLRKLMRAKAPRE
jgi:uncharacterized protein (DUF1778 family)